MPYVNVSINKAGNGHTVCAMSFLKEGDRRQLEERHILLKTIILISVQEGNLGIFSLLESW